MFSSLRSALEKALLLGCCLLSLAVRAQVIKPDTGGASCEVSPECEKHKYKFFPGPGQTFLRWQVCGDVRLLSPDDQNPAVICSNGYGKGRITAVYYTFRRQNEKCYKECPDTVCHTLNYDVFKTFPPPNPISGPECVSAGQAVTYSVPPILTDWPHRALGIGTDSYFWSGFPASSIVHIAGDSSTITLVLPAGFSAFELHCQIGRCNKSTASLTIQPALALLGPAPSCRPTTSNLPFTLTVDPASVSPGDTYSWTVPTGCTVSYANAGGAFNTSATIRPTGGAAGLISVTRLGGNTCPYGQTATTTLTRELATTTQANGLAYNEITCNPSVNCFQVGASYTFAVRNAPANTLYHWTYPAGWALSGASQASTINLTPLQGAAAGMITVTAESCTGVVLSRPLALGNGQVPGCTFSLIGLNSPGLTHVYAVVPDPANSCLRGAADPNNTAGLNLPNNRYTFRLINPATGNVLEQGIVNYPGNVYQFGQSYTGAWNNFTVSVQVENAYYCLDQTYLLTSQNRAAIPTLRQWEGNLLSDQQLNVYPNPADQTVQVELGADARAALTLHDGLGRVVNQSALKAGRATLSVKSLPEGQYWLRVDHDRQVLHRLLEITH